jgi:hypothetical protein
MDGPGIVLVLEADRTLQDSVREIVEREGYRVVTARSLDEAKSVLTKHERPCLILLDKLLAGGVQQALGSAYPLATIPVRVSGSKVRRISKKALQIEELRETLARYCGQARSS